MKTVLSSWYPYLQKNEERAITVVKGLYLGASDKIQKDVHYHRTFFSDVEREVAREVNVVLSTIVNSYMSIRVSSGFSGFV